MNVDERKENQLADNSETMLSGLYIVDSWSESCETSALGEHYAVSYTEDCSMVIRSRS